MDNFEQEELGKNTEKPRQEEESALRQKARGWREEHRKDMSRTVDSVCPEGASGIERALCGVAAHDIAIIRELAHSELAVAKQVGILVESASVKHVVALSKILSDLSKNRTEATNRVTNILTTVETMATRRRLAAAEETIGKPHLRRVV